MQLQVVYRDYSSLDPGLYILWVVVSVIFHLKRDIFYILRVASQWDSARTRTKEISRIGARLHGFKN